MGFWVFTANDRATDLPAVVCNTCLVPAWYTLHTLLQFALAQHHAPACDSTTPRLQVRHQSAEPLGEVFAADTLSCAVHGLCVRVGAEQAVHAATLQEDHTAKAWSINCTHLQEGMAGSVMV